MTDDDRPRKAPTPREIADLRFREGMALHKRGKLPEAKSRYAAALRARPDAHAIYNNLGAALNTEGRPDLALPYYRRAVAAEPDNLGARMNLARALRNLGVLDEAAAIARGCVASAPDQTEALQLLGLVTRDLRQFDEATRAFAKMLDLDPQHAEAGFELAFTLLLAGDLKRGFDAYEARWRMPRARKLKPNDAPRWDGGDLAGQTIWVRGEQGFGDAIQFVRYLRRLKAEKGAGRVVLETRSPLKRLFAASLADVDAIADYDEDAPPHDVWTPLLSLPRHFPLSLDAVDWPGPYLFAPKRGPRFSYAGRAGHVAVGLCWGGSPTHLNDKRRSVGLETLLPVLSEPRALFVTLQKGPRAAEVDDCSLNGVVWGDGDRLRDFADTAAMIDSLDLVISVDTSVVHLAGALGKPVWMLTPYSPDWRWLVDRDDTPWYPDVRIYRQEKAGDWAPVVAQVAADLSALCAGS